MKKNAYSATGITARSLGAASGMAVCLAVRDIRRLTIDEEKVSGYGVKRALRSILRVGEFRGEFSCRVHVMVKSMI